MDAKYIIKCRTKEELDCIKNGLDVYKIWLMTQVNSFGTDNNLIDDYNKTLELVEKMIDNLR